MGNQVTTPESGGNVPAVNLTGTGTTASSSSAHSAAPGGPIQYTLSIKTGNIEDAGTNANVYVILIGENGSESGLLRLPAKDVQGKKYFQKGQTDVISVTGPDVGEVRKVRVGHDNKGFGAGWFLDSITVKSPKMNDETNFVCRRWLDKKQDDGQIIREIIASKSSSGKSSLASYKITVKTGDVAGAGTDANVFICIFGDKGDTGNRVLTSQKNAFERNQVDIFNVEAEDVGVLKKIRIGHDNKGIGASWFLESVTITNEKRGTWTFPCNKWFDKEHDDKQLVRDVYTDEQQATATETMYTVTVVTGNLRGAGTNSKVTVNIFGEKGETGERSLENARDNFARGKTDTFDISAMELGDLRKLRIGHDGTGIGSDWLLDGVKVRNERTGKEWAFPCGKWLSNSMENCSSVTELVSSDSEFGSSVTNYRITVKTGDLRGSGTDADVFIQIYGENGDTGDRPLDNAANNFERGRIDVFGVESVDLGELKKIRIGHNGAGFGAGWFLDWVTVRNEKTTKEWKFPCGRWLAVDEDDKLIVRDLEPSDAAVTGRVMYKVEVLTGNRRGAGTDANVHMEMYGARGKSGIRVLDNADNNFERNQTDTFNIDCMDLGDLTKIRIGHDNSGFGGAWFLDKVIITNTSSDERYFFNCNRWLAKDEDDGLIERELPAEKEGQPAIPLLTYKVTVVTGDRRGAGTSAKVFVQIYGTKGDSGKRKLEGKEKSFKRNSTDTFGIECVDLGQITKIRVGHDNGGFAPGFFLDKIIINEETTNTESFFLHGRWLAKDEDDGEIEREIPASNKDGQTYAPLTYYKVTAVTGDRRGAGTDANVYVILYGENGDSGKRKLEGPGNLFERAQSDVFGFECVELGPIKKITIGHDGSGFGSGWFLDKVVVQSFSLKKDFYFLCGRWLDKSEDDGLIERDLDAQDADGTASEPLVRYKVAVTTGERRGAGTDANVFIQVYGKKGQTKEIGLDNPQNNFEAGKTDMFGFESADLGDLTKLRVWHDNAGFGASWFLDKIVITNMDTQADTFFLCGRWLSKDEEDGQITRELPASNKDGQTYAPMINYKVSVITGNIRGAGTDANVFITLFGDSGDSGKVKLSNQKNNFEKGQTDVFNVQCVDLGTLSKVLIEHDGTGFGAGWFLDKIIVNGKGQQYYFLCGRWLDKAEDDGLIARELIASEQDGQSWNPPVTYTVTVVTGDRRGAGTSAGVYINLYGKTTNSGEKKLEGLKNPFQRNQTDQFGVETVDLGDLTKIRVWTDNKGFFSAWFLDKIIVESEKTQEKWFFNCGKWLAKNEDDGLIERELPAEKEGADPIPILNYKVSVVTGDRRGAGTSAKVFITIYGKNGDTGKRFLEKDKAFQRNITDDFGVESVDLGELVKIRIGHDNGGFVPGWFLDKVTITEESSGKSWYFLCGKWLAKDEDDGSIERELPAKDKDGVSCLPMGFYQITTVTANRRGAGTDANVYITVFGENGDSGKRKLEGPGNLFERGRSDTFGFECVELGAISRIVIGHDGSGVGSGWFLDKVIVKSISLKKEWYFLCGKWLDKGEDDGKIERELVASEQDGVASKPLVRYNVSVTTGDRRGAGTDANVYIQVYGSKGKTKEIHLDNPQNNFERAKTDVFGFESDDLGDLTKLRVWHDNAGFGASWFLEKIVITNMDDNKETFFLCGKWLAKDEDDKKIERELPASDKDGQASLPLVNYTVSVITGDRKGAGTDANVYVWIYGANGDSGQQFLDKPGNCFERNQTDDFGLELVDLGDLVKLRVGHDNKGIGASWFLDKIIVTNETTQKKYYFLCGRWLAKDEEDGLIERELPARGEDGVTCLPMAYYRVTTVTGNRRGAGTDADVFVTIFGENGDTGPRKLEAAKKPFQKGQTDYFGVEAVDIGAVKKIKIGHNGSGPGDGWFVEKVIVKSETLGKEWFFLLGRWLAKDEEDGQIEIEMEPKDQDGQASLPVNTYRVTVITGDRPGAGTDANVFITIYGKNGDSGSVKLEGPRNCFERNKTDIFEIESVDLGEIKKIRIGHDNSKLGASWFLEKVLVTSLATNVTYYFLSGKWLSKDEDDKQIEREIAASLEDGVASQPLTKYSVSVKTGDIKGAGTDANVFVYLYGTEGESGRRLLDGPGNLFEKGQTDNFGFESVDLGDLTKLRIGHDDTGFGSDWFLESVTVKNETTSQEWKFPCNHWFAKKKEDGKIERDLFVNGEAGPGAATYKIVVITGNVRGAGTDADVHITIVGDKGKIDKMLLSNDKDNFEKGHCDIFGTSTTDLGDIKNITISQNGRGFGSAWFLDKVFIINETTSQRWIFPCNRWLAKREDDGKTERTLFPGDGLTTTYNIKVKTGLEKGAGTDANVYLYITGDAGKSDKLELKNSLTNVNKFERGQLDIFNIDCIDVGKISKIDIGHDNAGLGASWYLDCVEITNYATGAETFFPCKMWFDKSKDDKKIERELAATEKTGEIVDEYIEEEEEAPKDEKSGAFSGLKASLGIGKKEEKTAPVAAVDPNFKGGVLTVQVLSGRNLQSKDSNGLSDPYCEISLVDEKGEFNKKGKKKTKVIKKSLNPTWNESFQFETVAKTTALQINMYDEDMVGEDEFMGQVNILPSEFTNAAEQWITLKPRNSKDEVKGDIQIKLSFKQ